MDHFSRAFATDHDEDAYSEEYDDLPGDLSRKPSGFVAVPLCGANDTKGRAEALRDLSRSLSGGAVCMLGRRRIYPLPRPAQSSPEEALASLAAAVREEVQAQACASLGRPGGRGIDERVLLEVVRVAATHMSVGPGLQVAERAGLAPVLWQPIYIVACGAGQVRVLTFAFIGEPVWGDRPDRKHTPFVLRLTTADLVPTALDLSEGRTPSSVQVGYLAENAVPDAEAVLSHVVELEGVLFPAVETGRWAEVFGVPAAAPATAASSLPAPQLQSHIRPPSYPPAFGPPGRRPSLTPPSLTPPGSYQPQLASVTPPGSYVPPLVSNGIASQSASLPFSRYQRPANAAYFPSGPGPPPAPSQPRAMLTQTPLPAQSPFAGQGFCQQRLAQAPPFAGQMRSVNMPSWPVSAGSPQANPYGGRRW